MKIEYFLIGAMIGHILGLIICLFIDSRDNSLPGEFKIQTYAEKLEITRKII